MLFDRRGNRKYLTTDEWRDFLRAADTAPIEIRSFCWTLAHTGGRLSEVRALTARHVESSTNVIRLECLKRRQRGIFRELPVSVGLMHLLEKAHSIAASQVDPELADRRLWPWSRTTAWSHD